MKIKRFFAKDMRTALNEVKEELGLDAVIMSNKKMADGVEIVAAVDYDKRPVQAKVAARTETSVAQKQARTHSNVNAHTQMNSQYSSKVNNFVRPKPLVAKAEPEANVADSLEALLNRQSTQSKENKQSNMFNNKFDENIEEVNDDSFESPWYKKSNKPERALENSVNKELNNKEMQAMQDEMAAIRQLLEHQVSGLMTQDLARRDPTRAYMIERLRGMGISDDVADQMACFIPDDVSEKKAWQALLEMVQSQLYTTNNEILRQGGVFALVGPTGVGKTTTVAKLAALGAQKFGADKVALITTDTYRIGAYEQLATYGRIIGCPVKQVKDANELAEVLYHLRGKRLVLVDTAGMSQRDLRLTEQLNTLMRNVKVDIRSYLVLSATAQVEVLQETVKHFKKVQLSGCIFTKLDECLSLGEIISIAIQNRLPIGYLTNGQRVPEDIRVANAEKLVKKAEQMYAKKTKAQYQRDSTVESQTVGMYD
ncbi:flagellar biosynthesis protein FlhF [Pseudoalteromonas sp. NBT06-2]|uniref:flagellar biosynthesis protein FlhF n=1 Tax=Pseudoalteromonas sp. NBT06-2 TaxID=2025950 RepID=UPI000BA6B65C|nr:flagellar biosynthesis protein FlhF [Pseudoalteromonas sp. NBT06-2]PAJ74656.1 flagellar biosynthesis protein FlhF [Pseudoalteromonas sp. NBT06-2]